MDSSLLTLLVACDAALALLALGCAVVSLYFRAVPPELHNVTTQVRSLDSDLSELSDKVNHWMRRDAVRRARAGREEGDAGASSSPATPMTRKQELRARIRLAQGNPQ